MAKKWKVESVPSVSLDGKTSTAYRVNCVDGSAFPVGKNLDRANLISAAPEMLDALKAILAWDEANTSIAINTEGCEVIAKIRAAIAKASGGR